MHNLTDYYKQYIESIHHFTYDELISDYKSTIKESLYSFSKEFFNNIDYNDWINLTYEDAVTDNSELTEDLFYKSKYTLAEKYGVTPYYKIWASELFETLNKSVIMTDNIEKIKKIPSITDIEIINGKYYKIAIYFNNDINKESLVHLMNLYGYSKEREYDGYVIYEAVKPKALINYTDTYLYHITTKDKLDKILTYGLIPKQKPNHHNDWVDDDKKNLEYPGRIYLFRSSVPEHIMKSFINLHNRICGKISKPVLLIIVMMPCFVLSLYQPNI